MPNDLGNRDHRLVPDFDRGSQPHGSLSDMAHWGSHSLMSPIRWISKNKRWFFSGLGTTIAFVVVGLVLSHHGNDKGSQIQQGSQNIQAGRDVVITGPDSDPKEPRYKMTEYQFRVWCDEFPRLFEKQREKFVFQLSKRGMLNTGVGVGEYVEFLEDTRRSMDRTIDSFRIEYAIQGGDTFRIPVQCRKKLPGGNYYRAFVRNFPELDDFLRGKRLDTL
ncbi:MAG TPA: hypothetical protein VN285_06975 [Candidatus Deferrimicrobium sp.]|nr:hypothetical protein [Candidatus Deferrimicrobium sp.]